MTTSKSKVRVPQEVPIQSFYEKHLTIGQKMNEVWNAKEEYENKLSYHGKALPVQMAREFMKSNPEITKISWMLYSADEDTGVCQLLVDVSRSFAKTFPKTNPYFHKSPRTGLGIFDTYSKKTPKRVRELVTSLKVLHEELDSIREVLAWGFGTDCQVVIHKDGRYDIGDVEFEEDGD